MRLYPHQGLLVAITLVFTQVSFATVTDRTDVAGPEADGVEVIAGTGYGHTLFDSAENKCQHCHNDLYDTWKTSMHAKSWADPIFQTKYQDFLRLQASKIGAVGPTGTYSTGPESGVDDDGNSYYLSGTIQKAGQVCIKCHAPAAFYSSDYKIILTEVGDQNVDTSAYDDAKATEQSNLAPAYNPAEPATVVSMAQTGKVYKVSYHIGNSHNREGINCAYCHGMETVRLMNDMDGDHGLYTLANPIKMGPIGPIVREAGTDLIYSPDASTPDMNAFFALIGPDKGNVEDTAKEDFVTWDASKGHDGRYVVKSVATGCESYDADGNCVGTRGYYTGGPFYGPFGVTGLSNSRDDDLSDRAPLVKAAFQAAVDDAHGDKFESKHQFAAYGKALCLSCHQRSSLMLNPDSADGDITVDSDKVVTSDHQFLELCSTWTAFSDGVGNNFEDTATSPKCQRCHMEPLTTIEGDPAVVLHKWDDYPNLFTSADADLTHHFLPPEEGSEGPVAEGYLNNHAFMGANTADFGLTKIKTGFEASLKVRKKAKQTHKHRSKYNDREEDRESKYKEESNDDDWEEDEKSDYSDKSRDNDWHRGSKARKGKKGSKIVVETTLQNKTAHMFPGAHPMRRVLTRLIVTDANGNKLSFKKAKGKSRFKSITNQVAVLDGNSIMPGFDTVKVKYDKDADVVIQGYGPDLSRKGERVSSQYMDTTMVDWVSPDGTVINSAPVCLVTDADTGDCTKWGIKGEVQVSKILDIDGKPDHFTRIYGRETGRYAPDGTHVVRPGFDSNIAADNRLKPNEMEKYTVEYDAKNAVFPLTVKYKVYYMKKGASGKAPARDDGFLDTSNPTLAILEVFSEEITIDD